MTNRSGPGSGQSASGAADLPHPLLLALWLALSAGLIEGTVRLIEARGFHKILGLSPHVIWMAPAANLFWLGVPALILWGLSRLAPRRVGPRVTNLILFFIALSSLMLLFQSMYKVAAFLLAAGCAVQISRVITGRASFSRLVRRTTPILLLLAVSGGIAIAVSRRLHERRALSSLPAATPGAPNVLLIIWDTVRWQELSVYGYDQPTTPFLEQFASEGVRFEQAISTAPWTLASHGSMFMGRRPREVIRTPFKPLVDTFPTLSGVLASQGYATGGFTANLGFTTREYGVDRGFATYHDFRLNLGTIIVASRLGKVLTDIPAIRKLVSDGNLLDRKSAEEVSQEFLDWVSHRKGAPYFAFLNFFDAHRPQVSPEPFRSRFLKDDFDRFHFGVKRPELSDISPDELSWIHDNYVAAIAYEDDVVRRLLAELDRRGLTDNTLVIIAADHGDHFGDHGRIGHGNSVYRQLLQVPLLMRLPGRIPAGMVVTEPVSLIDLPSTILGLTGQDAGGIPGSSLARTWLGQPAGAGPASPIFSEMAVSRNRGAFSLIAKNLHYIGYLAQSQPPEIYDLQQDPLEERNLSARPDLAPSLQEFFRMSETIMGTDALKKRRSRPPEPTRDDGVDQ